jgi:hypothetical protein
MVVCVWEEVAEATSPEGTGENGLFDSTGHLVALHGEVGDIFWAEVVACGSGVLAYSGGEVIGEGQFGLVVVLPHLGVLTSSLPSLLYQLTSELTFPQKLLTTQDFFGPSFTQ